MFLVTGAKGQLGQEFKKIYTDKEAIFLSKAELDITDIKRLDNYISEKNINVIINCAAYTDVEQAENNIGLCNRINIIGAQNLAEISKKYKILIIHISTDYVYDGKHNVPYKESDSTNPLSVYGKSKLQAENILLELAHSVIIIRAGWLYSEFRKNFVNTILNLAKEKLEINVIYDQIGTPTYALDLANAIFNMLNIIDKEVKISKYNKKEIYNYSNEGIASWYDFAYEIIRKSNGNCNVMPIAAKDYKTLAKRPYYTVLDKTKIKKDFNIKIRHWSNAVQECLNNIKERTNEQSE